jgi:hypothetical protein
MHFKVVRVPADLATELATKLATEWAINLAEPAGGLWRHPSRHGKTELSQE